MLTSRLLEASVFLTRPISSIKAKIVGGCLNPIESIRLKYLQRTRPREYNSVSKSEFGGICRRGIEQARRITTSVFALDVEYSAGRMKIPRLATASFARKYTDPADDVFWVE